MEFLKIEGGWSLQFSHAAGRAASRFLTTLRDEQRLLGSPCPSCGRVRVPPRQFCENCFVRTLDDWPEVGPEGTVIAFTRTHAQFPGTAPPPHLIAYVLPDGADTALCNFVAHPDGTAVDLTVGQRVRAHFVTERQARITDFYWTPE